MQVAQQAKTPQQVETTQPTTTPRVHSVIAAMVVGLMLTIVATIVPFVTSALRNHIRTSYPAYTYARVDSAVNTWLVVLTIIGALGVIGWLWSIRIVAAQAVGELGGDRNVRARHLRRRHRPTDQGQVR